MNIQLDKNQSKPSDLFSHSLPYLSFKENTVSISITVKPNAKKSEILGVHNNRIKIAVKAPAQEGKANKELLKFLSKVYDLPLSYFEISSGDSSKDKRVTLSYIPSKEVIVEITQKMIAQSLMK